MSTVWSKGNEIEQRVNNMQTVHYVRIYEHGEYTTLTSQNSY
jgi:hypothetical protein